VVPQKTRDKTHRVHFSYNMHHRSDDNTFPISSSRFHLERISCDGRREKLENGAKDKEIR
jgi:hypothetical protein